MVRQAIKNDVPDEWKRRLKAGLCPVCGKTQVEFDKGMQIFCSHKCRDDYASKYTWWSEIRDKILKRDNETCRKCGINNDKHRKQQEKLFNKKLKEWIEKNKDFLEVRRNDRLASMSRQFEENYKEVMDDMRFARLVIPWEDQKELVDVSGIAMEVDHKIAVALGGDMWDEDNMQTLCENCHKEKTKEDMKKINGAKQCLK
jgi:ribosomal protein L37AE/L43A